MKPVTITCKACSKSYRIPAEKLPKKDRIVLPCPNCKARITLNLAAAPAVPKSGQALFKAGPKKPKPPAGKRRQSSSPRPMIT